MSRTIPRLLRRPPRREEEGARLRPQPVGGTEDSWGTVVAVVGRYFAGEIDLLTRDRFKSLPPITGSPLALAGEPDPAMQHHATSDGVSDRSRVEVRKDLAAWFRGSGAHALVVDNSAVLLRMREVDGRYYTVVAEDEPFMDAIWRQVDEETREASSVRPSRTGFTEELRAAYDAFIDACLTHFPPHRIVLVRSHIPRFWADDAGRLHPQERYHQEDEDLLAEVDAYFAERTRCRLSDVVLDHVPRSPSWRVLEPALQSAIEQDVVELITAVSDEAETTSTVPVPPTADEDAGGQDGAVGADGAGREDGQDAGNGDTTPERVIPSAARYLVVKVAAGSGINRALVRAYFERGGATLDDVLALAYLDQERPGELDKLIAHCVRRSVADPTSRPRAATRARFERSMAALRSWRWCSVKLPDDPWQPQITVRCGPVVLRFRGDGTIERVATTAIEEADAAAVVEGRVPLTVGGVESYVASWPVYLERGRRGITAAPAIAVSGADELLASCSWLDWSWVLAQERFVITGPQTRPSRSRPPDARTDLSFVFDPRTRICTVGGGLMDQVTHVALFDDLCGPHGLELYLDDFRYTWWRSHNGFEASRLAPGLEERRMTRRVSTALLDGFRSVVREARLPWVFNQSRAWLELGLHEAFVVTRDYRNARRLPESDATFPYLVYEREDELGPLVRTPPQPLTFFTTQHRIPIAEASAGPLARVFSYQHLEQEGLPPEVAATAAELKRSPHVAFHVRRGDYLNAHFDRGGWFSHTAHYVRAIELLIDSELGTSDFDVAVFSDDLEFVEANTDAYGLDRVTGTVRFMRGNRHFGSIHDSYLMALCPVVVGSVGSFAATTSLLADPPSTFIRTRPNRLTVEWRRT